MESNTHTNKRPNHKLKEEKEPLFIEDRTNSFKLNYAIRYTSPPNDKKHPRSNKGYKQNACWNCCSTDHSLINCPAPRNQRMISQNRYIFQMQKQRQQQQFGSRYGPGGQKNNRYFLANDLCSHFIPGKLSDDLVKALDIPKDGIPLHVYKMRKYGYPSGWLEEARDKFSGISIFTAPNECLPFPGKEKAENNIFFCNLNERKLHKYPGFNAPCPPGAVDEYKKIGCPEYDPNQSVNIMYERLKNTIMDKKPEEFPFRNSERDVVTQIVSDLKAAPKNKITDSIPDQKDNLSDGKASSLEDGEITDDEDNEKNVESVSNETNELVLTKLEDEQNNSEICVEPEESINDKSLSNSTISESGSISTPSSSKRKFGDVKSEVLGTPVIKHFSTYEKRPTHENFAKGMVDLIDHENLPNAVGTYKKLNEILKDVRKTMNNSL